MSRAKRQKQHQHKLAGSTIKSILLSGVVVVVIWMVLSNHQTSLNAAINLKEFSAEITNALSKCLFFLYNYNSPMRFIFILILNLI